MKFKCDENLPQEATELLRQAGYDAFSIHDQGMVGALDATIAAVCQSENRIIVTLDTDFADLRTYPPSNYSGIIVLRIRRQDKPYVLSIMRRIVKALENAAPTSQLWIVDEERVRIRQ